MERTEQKMEDTFDDKKAWAIPFSENDYYQTMINNEEFEMNGEFTHSMLAEKVQEFDIEKEGFDYAFRAYSNYPEVKNKKFQELRKEYLKSADKLEKYLTNNNIEDSEADVDTESVIAKEGFEDLFVYHDWKGVKDKKFKELGKEYMASKKALEKHLK